MLTTYFIPYLRTHVEEAQNKGLSEAFLLDPVLKGGDQLSRDLHLLALQQEKLAADLTCVGVYLYGYLSNCLLCPFFLLTISLTMLKN